MKTLFLPFKTPILPRLERIARSTVDVFSVWFLLFDTAAPWVLLREITGRTVRGAWGPGVRLDARSALGRSVPASDLSDGSGAILAGLAAVLDAPVRECPCVESRPHRRRAGLSPKVVPWMVPREISGRTVRGTHRAQKDRQDHRQLRTHRRPQSRSDVSCRRPGVFCGV